VKKLKRAFSEISEKAKPGDEQLAATQKFGVISQSQFMKDQDQKLVLALKGTDNFKHLEKNDFVISLRAFEGGIERSSQSGCVSPAYTVLRSKGEVSPDFAARLLKTPEFISQISMTYDGIREGKAIKFKDAGPVPLPIPPVAEQSAITTFIDGVLFKMDSAIASQERMIELLKERRSAIITQAVTKGLDSKAKMKDSGVPWLGQVPAHWEMKKLIHVAHGAGVKNTGMVEDNLLSLSYGRIIRKDIDKNEGLLPASFEGYQIVEEGDTVLRLTDLQNDQRSLRAGFVNERGIITSAYCAVRPTGISNRWLFNALRAADLLKVYYSMGGGVRQSLDFESIKRILIPVPPRAEQLAIDAYLVAEEERIRSAISSQERMIELLKERRSAIITQAVTGQIDVR
jgi:type I restriction enzyme S subunit